MLIGDGDLFAVKQAGAWFVPEGEISRHDAVPRPAHRPLASVSAWRLLTDLAEGAPVAGPVTVDDLLGAVRRRGTRRLLSAHRSRLPHLTTIATDRNDGQCLVGGMAAVDDAQARLVRDVAMPDLYVNAAALAALLDDPYVQPAERDANLVVRLTDDLARVPTGTDGHVAAAVGMVDMCESFDARVRLIGHNILTTLIAGTTR